MYSDSLPAYFFQTNWHNLLTLQKLFDSRHNILKKAGCVHREVLRVIHHKQWIYSISLWEGTRSSYNATSGKKEDQSIYHPKSLLVQRSETAQFHPFRTKGNLQNRYFLWQREAKISAITTIYPVLFSDSKNDQILQSRPTAQGHALLGLNVILKNLTVKFTRLYNLTSLSLSPVFVMKKQNLKKTLKNKTPKLCKTKSSTEIKILSILLK